MYTSGRGEELVGGFQKEGLSLAAKREDTCSPKTGRRLGGTQTVDF